MLIKMIKNKLNRRKQELTDNQKDELKFIEDLISFIENYQEL